MMKWSDARACFLFLACCLAGNDCHAQHYPATGDPNVDYAKMSVDEVRRAMQPALSGFAVRYADEIGLSNETYFILESSYRAAEQEVSELLNGEEAQQLREEAQQLREEAQKPRGEGPRPAGVAPIVLNGFDIFEIRKDEIAAVRKRHEAIVRKHLTAKQEKRLRQLAIQDVLAVQFILYSLNPMLNGGPVGWCDVLNITEEQFEQVDERGKAVIPNVVAAILAAKRQALEEVTEGFSDAQRSQFHDLIGAIDHHSMLNFGIANGISPYYKDRRQPYGGGFVTAMLFRIRHFSSIGILPTNLMKQQLLLTDEQAKRVNELIQKEIMAMGALQSKRVQSTADDQRGVNWGLEKTVAQIEEKVYALLTPSQRVELLKHGARERLRAMFVMNIFDFITSSEIRRELKLTAEQLEEIRSKRGVIVQRLNSRLAEIKRAGFAKLCADLSHEQRARFHAIVGEISRGNVFVFDTPQRFRKD